MNQHDTTMEIAGRIVAALASQTGEYVHDPIDDRDYVLDEEGPFRRNETTGVYYRPGVPQSDANKDKRYRMTTTYEQRIARYAAEIADLTVNAVQRKLNE